MFAILTSEPSNEAKARDEKKAPNALCNFSSYLISTSIDKLTSEAR